jgi:chromosome segregation ATPase
MIDISALPDEVVEYIVGLRKEAAKHRLEKKAAREEVGSLRLALGSLRERFERLSAELAEVRAASE